MTHSVITHLLKSGVAAIVLCLFGWGEMNLDSTRWLRSLMVAELIKRSFVLFLCMHIYIRFLYHALAALRSAYLNTTWMRARSQEESSGWTWLTIVKANLLKWNLAGAAADKQHAQLQMSFNLHDYLYQLVGVVVWWISVRGWVLLIVNTFSNNSSHDLH